MIENIETTAFEQLAKFSLGDVVYLLPNVSLFSPVPNFNPIEKSPPGLIAF